MLYDVIGFEGSHPDDADVTYGVAALCRRDSSRRIMNAATRSESSEERWLETVASGNATVCGPAGPVSGARADGALVVRTRRGSHVNLLFMREATNDFFPSLMWNEELFTYQLFSYDRFVIFQRLARQVATRMLVYAAHTEDDGDRARHMRTAKTLDPHIVHLLFDSPSRREK